MTTQLVGTEVPVFEGAWAQPDAASTALRMTKTLSLRAAERR
jgi:hypothetical protein